MNHGIEEIEVKGDRPMKELMHELELSCAPIVLKVGGEISFPDETKERRLKRRDRIALIPLVAGG